MKNIIKSIHPKLLFRSSKKSSQSASSTKSSISKSSPPSFGSSSQSSTTSSSSDASDTSTHTRLVTRTRSSDTLVYKFDAVSAFHMMDTDGDGKITLTELESLFTRLNGSSNVDPVTTAELGEMIREIDRDGDGCISLEELQSAVGSVFESTAQDEDELRGAFEYFDADHDGKIDAHELFQGLVKLGDERCTLEDCRRMIESVDLNQDGFVCFQDFSRMMDVIPSR